MRIALIVTASALALLTACGGPETSQANNSAGNISEENSPANTASASVVTPAGQPVSKQDAAKLMHERHEGMEAIGKATKTLGRELKGDSPDLAAVRAAAAKIAELAPKTSGWFPPGTGPDAGKTEAKALIWQKPGDFAVKTRDFQMAAAALNTVAQGSDVAAMKAAFGDLGKSCKACHDPSRATHK
jgi:cytochrome c556